MSWDAHLDCPHCGHGEEWNYTHNINPMLNTARDTFVEAHPGSWWQDLSGMRGEDGAEFVYKIWRELGRFPDRYKASNPPNGWGDYDSIRKVLMEMYDAGMNRFPDGVWSTHG